MVGGNLPHGSAEVHPTTLSTWSPRSIAPYQDLSAGTGSWIVDLTGGLGTQTLCRVLREARWDRCERMS